MDSLRVGCPVRGCEPNAGVCRHTCMATLQCVYQLAELQAAGWVGLAASASKRMAQRPAAAHEQLWNIQLQRVLPLACSTETPWLLSCRILVLWAVSWEGPHPSLRCNEIIIKNWDIDYCIFKCPIRNSVTWSMHASTATINWRKIHNWQFHLCTHTWHVCQIKGWRMKWKRRCKS